MSSELESLIGKEGMTAFFTELKMHFKQQKRQMKKV